MSITVEGKAWKHETCETIRLAMRVSPVRGKLEDLKYTIGRVTEKLLVEASSTPEIEVTFPEKDLEECLEAARAEGREEVWEMIRRMYLDTEDTMEAYTSNELDKAFGTYYLKTILGMPLNDILKTDRKLREEVKARNAIKVGDFITYDSPLAHYDGWVLTKPAPNTTELHVDVLTFKDGIPQVVSVEINKCEATGERNPYVAAMMKSLETVKGETK